MTDYEYITWEEVEQYIKTIPIPKDCIGVYGIPRGGTVLAVMLSYYHKLPLLLSPMKGCIVIDDIADTGKTLMHYKEKGYYLTVMYYHKQSQVVPDHHYKEKGERWIVYPWEMNNLES